MLIIALGFYNISKRLILLLTRVSILISNPISKSLMILILKWIFTITSLLLLIPSNYRCNLIILSNIVFPSPFNLIYNIL